MKHEFEALAGYEVSFDDYNNIIEPMYMAIPDKYTKEDFVKMIDKKRFALPSLKAIKADMRRTAQHLRETCDHYTDWEAKEHLQEVAEVYRKRIGAAGECINTKWTLEYLGCCRGCTYPASIDFYDTQYRTIEKVALIK